MGDDVLSELLRANDVFYGVFAAGDIEGMDALWAVRAPVACIHPGWPALHGREQVMSSWREILLDGEAPEIRCEQPYAFAVGDAGIVTCVERFADAARLIGEGLLVESAVGILEKTPKDRWPAKQVEPVIDSIAGYVSRLAPTARTAPHVLAAIDCNA